MFGGRAARNSGLMELVKLASLWALNNLCSLSCWAITSWRMASGRAARKVGSMLVRLGIPCTAAPPPSCDAVAAVVVGGEVVMVAVGVVWRGVAWQAGERRNRCMLVTVVVTGTGTSTAPDGENTVT